MVPFWQNEKDSMIDEKKIKGRFFQICGFDIMIDDNLKPWLIELNDHPSLNVNFDKEPMNVKKELMSLSEVDKYVKTRVLSGAIKLAKISSAVSQ